MFIITNLHLVCTRHRHCSKKVASLNSFNIPKNSTGSFYCPCPNMGKLRHRAIGWFFQVRTAGQWWSPDWNRFLWLQKLLSRAFYFASGCRISQLGFVFLFFVSSKLQHVVETFQSLLTNNTPLGTGEKGAVATWATEVLQTVESAALETALKSPEHKIQEIHNNTVGKKTIWPDTHRGLVTNWSLGHTIRKINTLPESIYIDF